MSAKIVIIMGLLVLGAIGISTAYAGETCKPQRWSNPMFRTNLIDVCDAARCEWQAIGSEKGWTVARCNSTSSPENDPTDCHKGEDIVVSTATWKEWCSATRQREASAEEYRRLQEIKKGIVDKILRDNQ